MNHPEAEKRPTAKEPTDAVSKKTISTKLARTQKTNDEIYRILRLRICKLKYQPGMILHESQVSEEFNISRTPIRAILQRLGHDGLIDSRDGVGNIVTQISEKDLHDIYQMRMKLAELSGHMNPEEITPKHCQIIETLLERALVLIDAFNAQEYWQINHDLQTLLNGLINNTALRHTIQRFYYQSARIWYNKAREMQEDAAQMLLNELAELQQALLDNDAVAIGYIRRNHIAASYRRITL